MELGSNYKRSSKDGWQDKPAALVLNLKVDGLAVIKSLARKEIPVLAADSDLHSIGPQSKYAKGMVCPGPPIMEGKI